MDASIASFFSPRCGLVAEGPDARSFLQGQATQDLVSCRPGEVCYGLLLDRKGKIVADAFFLCWSEERFELVSVYCRTEDVAARLDAFLVMDEVELSPQGRASGASIWGPAAREALPSLGLEGLAERGFVERDGVLGFWARDEREPRLMLIADAKRREDLETATRAALAATGGALLGEEAATARAARAVEPRVGVEIRLGADLPQECGLIERAVSFNKGCYLGQEVMARLRSLGRVRKGFFEVEIEGDGSCGLPSPLADETGKRWGELRSAARDDCGACGLAILSLESPGALRLPDGTRVRKTSIGDRR